MVYDGGGGAIVESGPLSAGTEAGLPRRSARRSYG